MESKLKDKGRTLEKSGLSEMDAAWDEVKAEEGLE